MIDGTELPRIRQLSHQLAIEDCVEFTGRISDPALRETMSTEDVCVNLDRANEMNDKSTMNAIIEYMALGKPIVQFDLTEGRFSAGVASLRTTNDVADFAVKLCELLDDPDRRTSLAELERSRVESHAGLASTGSAAATGFEPSLAGNQRWRAPAFCRNMRNSGSKEINVRRVAGEGK
jgi:glycosyltransferase involved in cell wall biosynthesis